MGSYDFIRMASYEDREVFFQLPAPESFSYIHSFSMTRTYLVFVTYPLSWNVSSILFSPAILPNLYWRNDVPTRIHLVHRVTKKVRVVETNPIFSFHHVNAYDGEDGKVHLDMIVYPNKTCFDELSLSSLRHGNVFSGGTFRRYVVGDKAVWNEPAFPRVEMPQIHPAFRYRPYRYAYGMGVNNNLVRLDLDTHAVMEWREPHHFPTEPVFVALSEKETDGVLVSVVYDSLQNQTYLVVVNATTMKSMAIMYLAVVIPFTCHGFFQEKI